MVKLCIFEVVVLIAWVPPAFMCVPLSHAFGCDAD